MTTQNNFISHPTVSIGIICPDECEPMYATALSSGADLLAYIPSGNVLVLPPGERTLIPTGIRLEIPPGWEAQIRSRSGLSLKHGVVCLNSPGTIDADYRGEIKVILANLGKEPFEITHGLRIAQMVFAPVAKAEFVTSNLSETSRGTGGFGSTGMIR
jgi:dUTP pyrophosphatase